jgi:acetyl-CoA carboxylase biotin carboxyl carrier protein
LADSFTPEEIEKTRQLLELFAANSLTELSLAEADGFAVEIGVAASYPAEYVQASPPVEPTATVSSTPKPAKSKPTAAAPKASHATLNSPMVGIFYTSPTPEDPPFVSVGDIVTIGQTIGLIEAMKVFSEIPSEAAGRIVEVVAQTGTLVQQSQPLYSIEAI